MEAPKATLFIGRFSSHCNNCGAGADPDEKSHVTKMGYGSYGEGCGIEWTHVAAEYTHMDDLVAGMRPDLILFSMDEQIAKEVKNG